MVNRPWFRRVSQNRQFPSCPRRGGRRPGWREQRPVTKSQNRLRERAVSIAEARTAVRA